MKVPNNLLHGISGKKNGGIALFAMVLMAIAGIGGAVWGIWAKFATPVNGITCPGNTVPQLQRASFKCEACGMG